MERTPEELIAHIAARVARGKPVTLSVHSGRTVMNALMAQAGSRVRTWEEDLHFELGIWDERGKLVEVLARIGNLKIARAAFRAAVIARPDSHVMLKQGGSVSSIANQMLPPRRAFCRIRQVAEH